MVYTTDDTEWPGFDFSTAIKKLISDFFLILDSEDKNAGDQLADNIFAADGTAFFGGYAFVGTEGMLSWVLGFCSIATSGLMRLHH